MEYRLVSEFPEHLKPEIIVGHNYSDPLFDITLLDELLDAVQKSTFSTIYATVNPYEDFAEHYAQAYLQSHWVAEKNGNIIFDDRAFRNEIYDAKTEVVLL